MTQIIIKKSLDEWLDNIDYSDLADGTYVPSKFALVFMNFIKLVNGSEGESHKTPPVHLRMLDKTVSDKKQVANLCFRGAAKTTLFFEYFSMFLGTFGVLPNFGKVEGMIYVSDSMENGVKSARNNTEFRYNNSEFMQEYVPYRKFTDNYIEFGNKDGHRLGIKMFGAKTGLRGTKIFGKRPKIAVLDDLLSDDDARSPTAINAIKDTIYKGVNYALDPVDRKTIFNGTPFNSEDPLVEAVESGAWDVNVWPVCERFPVEREDFVGAWEDRFSYDFIKEQYDNAVLTGKVAGFMQELMLRISSDEERLVQDSEIGWYSRKELLQRKGAYNYYITTDFAVSDKARADYSVISVWAYNANGDWFWVDGFAERCLIDKTINKLFEFAAIYRPQQTGIEISGQQGAFIKILQQEMMKRNIWFSFASSQKSGEPGIRPVQNKLERFNLVVPWFKSGKMFFPSEMKSSVIMGLFMGQIKLVTMNGIKGKDDCVDTISQLAYLTPWKPTDDSGILKTQSTSDVDPWEERAEEEVYAISSYIV
jgi:phage terminase large subunit-like protein